MLPLTGIIKISRRLQEKFRKIWKYYWGFVSTVLWCSECLGMSLCVSDFLWIWYVFLSGRWNRSLCRIKLCGFRQHLGLLWHVWNGVLQCLLAGFHQGTTSWWWNGLVYMVPETQKVGIGWVMTVRMWACALRKVTKDVLHAIWMSGNNWTTAWFDVELISFFYHAVWGKTWFLSNFPYMATHICVSEDVPMLLLHMGMLR